MTWLEYAVVFLLKNILGLDESHVLFPGISFFIYDVIKIFILLSVVIYISSFFLAAFKPERTRQILSKFGGFKGNMFGALLGTVTPFCSCSSIPIFIGFTKAGLPLGMTFSFLISSPLVDIASIILLSTIFGIDIALYYVISGLFIAVIGGTLIQLIYSKNDVASFVYENFVPVESYESKMTFNVRHTFAKNQVIEIYKRVWLFIFIGVFIGAIIHGYIPQAWILSILGNNSIFDVIIASLLGAPIYADIFGALPIAEALVSKGVKIGTVLAFMMSVTTLSIPSIILLKQVLKKRLLIGFMGIVLLGIIFTGFMFNILF
jgi:uncharacterized membrane protein YraQ (UPF0718 family)